MKKFRALTKYIKVFENKEYGKWFVDTENDGSKEHPKQWPFVMYGKDVLRFEDDLYNFCKVHEEYEHWQYYTVLEEKGIRWDYNDMANADVSDFDEKYVICLLIAAVRAERFCDGALLRFLKDGLIQRWLKRLEEIDNKK